MQRQNIIRLVEASKRLASLEFSLELDDAEITQFLKEILYGPKDLWKAAELGLITRRELASAVGGHVHTWLIERSGANWETRERHWDPYIDDFEAAIFPE